MKQHLMLAVLAVAAAACAAVPAANNPKNPDVGGITIQRMVWGMRADTWRIDRQRVTHTWIESLTLATNERTRTLVISTADFDAILLALKPAHDRLLTGVPCDGPLPTDQDTITIDWSRTGSTSSISLYTGCRSADMTSALAGHDKAVELLRSIEARSK